MRTRLWWMLLVAFLLAFTRPACGQVRLPDASDRFAWKPAARPTANVLSNVTLGAQLVIDTVHSIRGDETKRDLWRQVCSFGLSQSATLTAKHFVQRIRPDGSDRKSFWSGHAASAAQATDFRYGVGFSLTFGTGLFRVGAGKHDWLDVLSGAAAGTGARYVCVRLIQ